MKAGKKRVIHVITKIILIVLIGGIIFNLLVIGGLSLYHKSKLKDEAAYLKTPGRMYSVNGHAVHVLETGNIDAEQTLVFMHGTMATDSAIAMQPLFRKLEEKYHIVYIDRSGNGYSDASGEPRDVATMTEEMRQVMAEVTGGNGPYVLVPYYSAGFIALYWQQQYPEEVASIIGIDMSYPAQYEEYEESWDTTGASKLYQSFCKIGGHRFVASAYPENAFGVYTEQEMKTRRALVSKACYTEDMYNEDALRYENAKTIGIDFFSTNIPVLELLSNEALEPYLSTDANLKKRIEEAEAADSSLHIAERYNEQALDYYSQFSNVKCVEVAGPTRLYEYCPEVIAEEIIRFLDH